MEIVGSSSQHLSFLFNVVLPESKFIGILETQILELNSSTKREWCCKGEGVGDTLFSTHPRMLVSQDSTGLQQNVSFDALGIN